MSSTISTDTNIETRFVFPPLPQPAGEDGTPGARLYGGSDTPTPAEIEYLTKKIIAEILRDLPRSDVDPPRN